ncbi:MAG: hypothetical protein IPO39_07380 [Bacteroidetes bacterium]|nr:hypothetical protein [Bacteroidota bacterium]
MYSPRQAYRKPGGSYFSPTMQVGENSPNGLLLRYYLKQNPTVKLSSDSSMRKAILSLRTRVSKIKKGEP